MDIYCDKFRFIEMNFGSVDSTPKRDNVIRLHFKTNPITDSLDKNSPL